MAKMFPHNLQPEHFKSNAEAKLYKLFQEVLPPSWYVFHGRMLQAESAFRVKDVELDFLIGHPHYGILVVEVKGGGIRHDGTTGEWFTIGKAGKPEPLKRNPVDQARDATYTVVRYLIERALGFEWNPYYAVAFPDIDADNLIDPQLPRAIVLDKPLLRREKVASALEAVFKHYRRGATWANGPQALEKLRRTLAPQYILTSSLASEFADEADAIKKLTDDQFAILNDLMEDEKRLLVTGVAGSGKTLLAMEKARQLAQAGKRVLFTCFNQNLVHALRGQNPSEGLVIQHFHALAREYGNKPDYSDTLKDAGISQDDYFGGVLPSALLRAAEGNPALHFDAIFVDEGQDFKANYWPAVYALLKDGAKSPLYIFCDDAQRLYSQDPMIGQFKMKHLSRNMRNVKEIGEFAGKYRRAEGKYEAVGPTPKYAKRLDQVKRNSGKDGLLAALAEVLDDLIEEKVLPAQIVILTPYNDKSSLADGIRVGSYTLRRAVQVTGNDISVQSIYAFKGLEREVVILAELDRAQTHIEAAQLQTLMYVGASRAKHKLIIVGEMPNPGE